MREHTKMPDDEYFAIDAVSNSLLKRLDCPAKARLPMRPTAAMLLGTLVHCAVLEPREFDKRYVAAPKINKRTKAGKEEWAAFVEDNADKTVITIEEHDTSLYIARCVMAHPVAYDMLTGGDAERVFQWEDENTGVKCKAKADYVKGNVIADLKTAQDASPKGFAKACANFGYHWQDAHYSNGSQCDRFVFIVVETSYPFVVGVYELDDEAKAIGQRSVESAINKYVEIETFELWDEAYSDNQTVQKLSLPEWIN